MNLRKEKIAQSFGSHSDQYDQYADLQKEIAKNLTHYLPAAAHNILEIGCGTGFLTQQLAQQYPNATFDISDISSKMVKHTRQKFSAQSNMNFLEMDGENVTIEKKYDLIVSSMTFQWFDNPIMSVRALLEKLESNGKLIFSSLHASSFQEWRAVSAITNIPIGLLSPAEICLPVAVETAKKQYESGMAFLKELKTIGASIPNKMHKPNSPTDLLRLCAEFDQGDKNITWAIAYHVLDQSDFDNLV